MEQPHPGDQAAPSSLDRAVLEKLPYGIVVCSATPPDHVIVYANPAALRLTGHVASEVVGQPLRMFHGPQADQTTLKRIRDALRDGEPVHLELLRWHKDGSEFWTELELLPLPDALGRPTHGMAIYRDISERRAAETSLRESEAMFRTLADTVPVVIWQTTADGTTLFINQRWCEYTGTTLQENLDWGWIKCVHPEDHATIAAGFRAACAARRAYTVEYRLRRHDGAYRWVLDMGVPRFGKEGVFLGYIGSAVDIHDRKMTEIALRESAERIRALANNLPSGAIYQMIQPAAGPPFFTYVSEGIERLFGVRVEDVLADSQTIYRLIHPADAPRLYQAQNEALAQHTPFECQFRQYTMSGEIRWVYCRSAPRRHEGGATLWDGVVMDVTERVEANLALQASEERLRLALSSGRLATWDWDLLTNQVVWSRFHFEIFGYPDEGEDIPYERFRQRVHPDDLPEVEDKIRQAMETHADYHHEYRVRWPDGTVRWVVAHGAFAHDATGRPVRMTGVLEDITERRQAEVERRNLEEKLRETQKLESLGVLAGGIAHDFNNLLTGILGYTNLAEAVLPHGSPARAYLAQVEQASRRAADLCQQMLAYAGKGRYVVGPVDLAELVRDTAALLQLSVSRKAVLSLHLESGVPPVIGDASQLRQVVMNLVMNASEALGETPGSITLRVEVVRAGRAELDEMLLGAALSEGDYVALTVTDTGSGMDDATRARIFEPFFTTKFTGRGLGLSAVLGILRGHGGALRVDSAPGRGTTFRLLFPVGPARPEVRSSPSARPSALRGVGTVLVVDDEEAVRGLAAAILRAQGFDVIEARDGWQAIELFAQHQGVVRAVLLDLTMPILDGRQAFAEIHRRAPHVPVILMSGYAEAEMSNLFPDTAPRAFLQKPFTQDDLTARMKAVLRGASG